MAAIITVQAATKPTRPATTPSSGRSVGMVASIGPAWTSSAPQAMTVTRSSATPTVSVAAPSWRSAAGSCVRVAISLRNLLP